MDRRVRRVRAVGDAVDRGSVRRGAETSGEGNLKDEAIARKIKRGDRDGFQMFLDRHGAPLLGYLIGMVGRREEAEDLLQETVIRVHRNIDRYEERGTFRAWVYRIATNLALTRLRRASFEERPAADIPERPDEGAGDPHERVEKREQREILRAGIAALPEDHLAVILLRVRRGMGVR